MSKIKCYDVVESVLDEATKRFYPLFIENKERKNILKQYCSAIDKVIDDVSGKSIEVEVDEIKMTISICIGCEEITVYPDDRLFYQLFKRALTIGFSVNEDDGLMVIEFVFPSIWEKAI